MPEFDYSSPILQGWGGSVSTPEPDSRSIVQQDDDPSPIVREWGGRLSREEYADRTLKAGLAQGKEGARPWEETAKQLQSQGLNPDAFKFGYDVQAERNRYARTGEVPGGTLEQVKRNMLSFGDWLDVRGDKEYSRAIERAKTGQATEADAKTIARWERLAEIDANDSLGSKIRMVFQTVPKFVGEGFGAGKVLGLGGRMLGFGGAAARAPLAAAVNPSLTSQVASHAGRMAILLPMMPGMYVADARQRNIAAGRDATDWEGYGPALKHGYASLLVLGSLQKLGNSAQTFGGQLARKAGYGVFEQNVADTAAGVHDQFVSDAARINGNFGALGQLVTGNFGKAAEEAGIQALTFGLFAGLHGKHESGRPEIRKTEIPDLLKIPEAFASSMTATTKGFEKQGASRPVAVDKAARVHKAAVDLIEKKMTDLAAREGRDATREDAQAVVDGMNLGKYPEVKKYLDEIVKRYPEAPKVEPVKPAATSTEPVAKPEPAQPKTVTERLDQAKLEAAGWKEDAAKAARELADNVEKIRQIDLKIQNATDPAEKSRLRSERQELERQRKIRQKHWRDLESEVDKAEESAASIISEDHARRQSGLPATPAPEPRPYTPGQPRLPRPSPEGPGRMVPRVPVVEPAAPKPTESPVEAEAAKPPEPTPEGEIAPPAKPAEAEGELTPAQQLAKMRAEMGWAAPAESPTETPEQLAAERYYRVPDYKGAGSNVDAAIAEIEGSQFANKWFSRTREQNEGYLSADKIQMEFRNDRLGRDGDFVDRRVREVGIGGTAPISMHPAFSAIRYKGKPEGKNWERLVKKVAEWNEKRKGQGLDPIELEASEKAEPKPADPVAAKPAAGDVKAARSERVAEFLQRLENRLATDESPEDRRASTASSWLYAKKQGLAEEADAVAERFAAEGLSTFLSEGDVVPFNGRYMQSEHAVSDGQMVRVARQGLSNVGEKNQRSAKWLQERSLVEPTSDKKSRGEPWEPTPAKAPEPPRSLRDATKNPLAPKPAAEKAADLWRELTQKERNDKSLREFYEGLKKTMREGGIDPDKIPSKSEAKADVPEWEMEEYHQQVRDADIPKVYKDALAHMLSGGGLTEASRIAGISREGIRKVAIRVLGESVAAKFSKKFGEKKTKAGEEEEGDAGPSRTSDRRRGSAGQSEKRREMRRDALEGPDEFDKPEAEGDGKTPGRFEVVRGILEIFGLHRYVGRTASRARADYLEHVRAMEATGESVGDIALNVHEAAHHVYAERGIGNLLALSPVADAVSTFDYKPGRKNRDVALKEGFAEWFRKRSQNKLENLTPEQQKASEFLEQLLADRGVAQSADRVRDLVTRYQSGSVMAKAFGNISPDGKPARPAGQTNSEAVGRSVETAAEEWQDFIDDRLGVLARLQAEADRITGTKAGPGQDVRTVFANAQHMGDRIADEMLSEGVFTFRENPDGTRTKVRLSEGIDSITKGFADADLGPGGKLDTFIIARSVVSEVTRGTAMSASPDPATRAEGQRKMASASAEQVKEFKDFLDDLAKNDPQWYAKAEEAAKQYTKIANATLDALVEVGRLPAGQVEAWKQLYPDYVPFVRTMEGTGLPPDAIRSGKIPFRTVGGKARHGSGRQFVSSFVTLRHRLNQVGREITRQLQDNALVELNGTPEDITGVGGFFRSVDQPSGRTVTREAEVRKKLEALGFDDASVKEMMEAWGDAAVEVANPKPWDQGGQNLYYMRYKGQPVVLDVGSRPLYEILTGQQGNSSSAVTLGRAIAAMPIVAPLVRLLKWGATAGNMGFAAANPARDVWHYLQNAQNGRNLGERLLNLVTGQGTAAKAAALRLAGKEHDDPRVRLYYETGGEQLRALGFAPRGEGEAAYRRATGEGSGVKERAIRAVNKVQDFFHLVGFGEHGPRLAEWKAALEEMGYTREKVEAAMAADPNRSPIPLHAIFAARMRAAQATVDFSRQGVFTAAWNKIAPFFGAHVAGMSQEIRNWRQAAADMKEGKFSPKAKAMIGTLAAYVGLEVLHWWNNKDEEWYKELQPHHRYNWWVLGTDSEGRPVGVPKPQGPMRMLGANLQELLRGEGRQGMAAKAAADMAAPRTLPIGMAEARDVLSNTSWSGRPIVPRREDPDLQDFDQWAKFRIPYLLDQLTGGLTSLRGLKSPDDLMNAGSRPPAQSVDDFYEKLESMTREKDRAERTGLKYPKAAELKKLEGVRDRLAEIRHKMRGDKKVNGSWRAGQEPSEEEQKKLRAMQLDVVQKALKRAK